MNRLLHHTLLSFFVITMCAAQVAAQPMMIDNQNISNFAIVDLKKNGGTLSCYFGGSSPDLGIITDSSGNVPQFVSTFRVTDPMVVTDGCVNIISLDRNNWGHSSCGVPAAGSNLIRLTIPFSPHTPSDRFGIGSISLVGIGQTEKYIYFSTDPKPTEELMPVVEYVSLDPDTTPPEMDLNDISISSRPMNEVSPDGETAVAIRVKLRDDKSGVSMASYCLKSPLDSYVCGSIDDPAMYGFFTSVDPTVWRERLVNKILPVGSAPGSWGLSMVWIQDRAGNMTWHDLTEILHFKVEKD